MVAKARVIYPDAVFWEVAFLRFRGDQVMRSHEFHAEAFEAPAWRAQWVERMEGAGP